MMTAMSVAAAKSSAPFHHWGRSDVVAGGSKRSRYVPSGNQSAAEAPGPAVERVVARPTSVQHGALPPRYAVTLTPLIGT